MPNELKFMLAGFIVGSLVGFSGMGGGSVMTPLLIVLGLPPAKAIGSDLIFSALTKTLGSASHARKRHVEWRLAGWLALGSVPASILGVFTLGRIKAAMGGNSDALIQQVLGGMLILVGAMILFRLFFAGRRREPATDEPLAMTPRRKALAVGFGLVGGYGVGLTSIGSGTLFAIAMLTFFPLMARKVVGTDIAHATVVVWAAGLAHTVAGDVQFGTVAMLVVGSLPGVLLGSQLTARLPERPVRAALAGVLVLSGALLQ
jgi:uncharacterized protein